MHAGRWLMKQGSVPWWQAYTLYQNQPDRNSFFTANTRFAVGHIRKQFPFFSDFDDYILSMNRRKAARFWTAPVLWRFATGRGLDDGQNLVFSLSTVVPKAVEDYRSPRRFAFI